MWDVLTALIAALAPLIIPLLVIWLVITHWQQISAIIHDLITIPSIVIGGTASALTNEGLIFVGGLALIGLAFFAAERKIEPKAPPPVFAPIGPQGFAPIAVQAGGAARAVPYQFATPSTYTSAFSPGRGVYSRGPIARGPSRLESAAQRRQQLQLQREQQQFQLQREAQAQTAQRQLAAQQAAMPARVSFNPGSSRRSR